MMQNKNTRQTKIARRGFFSILILMAILIVVPWANLRASKLTDLNEEISEKKGEIENLGSKMESLEADVVAKQERAASLKNQVAILDAEIKKTENEIEKAKKEIEVTNLEIASVELQIEEKEQEIKEQKETLAEFIRVLHEYDQKNPVEILLGHGTLSDFMDQIEYLEILQNRQQLALDKLQDLKQELEWKKVELNSKKSELEELETKLEKNKKRLNDEISGRARLLEITQEEENQYQSLLEKAKEEYQKVNAEIAAIQRQIQKETEENRRGKKKTYGGGPVKGAVSFIWPVRGRISAYFMDPSYYAYFGVQHYGTDIVCNQGTPLKAMADAYVARCRNAGYGYSYIMLMHNDELATVYGHISAFNVTEGQYVKQGDIIGLSGGTPGTLGAGWMTTGAHLHLEVRVNGRPVDGLNYLP